MSDQFQREQELLALRQHIEQTFSSSPSVLRAVRAHSDALDLELRQLPSGTPPEMAINHLSSQQWFREAIEGNDYSWSEGQVHKLPEEQWQRNYDLAYRECMQLAINAGALEPQDWKERMAAGVMAANGKRWADTPVARTRLEAWTQEFMRREGFST